MQSAAIEIGGIYLSSPGPTIVYPTADAHVAKKAVRDNSVEKDIAQFIKKEVGSPSPTPAPPLLEIAVVKMS